MTPEDRRRIAHAVQEALRKEHESGKRARVQTDAITEENPQGAGRIWYYVPVEIAPHDRELGTFYELFSRVEESLEARRIDVLLVPVRQETPAGEFNH
jgi:hypothetical protein